MRFIQVFSCAVFALACSCVHSASPLECTNWARLHPQWLWCDDFETDASLEQSYFDVVRSNGSLGVVAEAAFGGASSLRNRYVLGMQNAGSIKFSIGKTPVAPERFLDTKFDEVFWRFYMRTEANWVGQPLKVTRAAILTSRNWAQAAIGHLWGDNRLGLALDPASGVSGASVKTAKWNDFANLSWLGMTAGKEQVYAAGNRDKWYCIEVHMKLNAPDSADGLFEFWVNDVQEARRTGLNWRGSYSTYGINMLMLEGWINSGAPQSQNRYFDNFVVSTAKIGCYDNG
jgi:hypothetical protein